MSQSQIKVTAIHAFSDNYIWAISSSINNEISLVDPGDAQVCIDYMEQNQLQLSNVLITHHHADHIGGVKALKAYANEKGHSVNIYGPATENIPCCEHKLAQDDVVTLTSHNTEFSVIEVFGHTAGHIAYYNKSQDILFCGDTLFSGGCGRLFEGTPAQMHQSLKTLAALPQKTQVYCAHEYTLANLSFALAVEPQNDELIHYYNHATNVRAKKQSTIPTSIAQELKINPFLRCHLESVQQSASEYLDADKLTSLETFTAIRQWKDNF